MAKLNNNLNNLANHLSRSTTKGAPATPAESVAKSEIQVGTAGSQKLPRLGDTKTMSFSAKVNAAAINFSKPSASSTAASSNGNPWMNLLKQTASGGIASALGGSLGGVGGLGSIVAGFVSLFSGGKGAPPPLVQFQMPASQEKSVSVGPVSGSVNQSSSSGSTAGSAPTQGVPGNGSQPHDQPLQYQSSQIASAVKLALLNSSSLNDVIAEI